MDGPVDFWERPEVVASFAAREPDHRLVRLLDAYPRPGSVRVLDIGCAGGRNAELLARRGFDVHALDASTSMVEATRARVGALPGDTEAARRVRPGRMDDLGEFGTESFDLVVSLGTLHNAKSWAEWQRAVAEIARVLRRGGRLLLSQFTPATDLTGDGVRPVAGEPCVYDGLPAGRATLLFPADLDRALAAHGLSPEVATAVGETKTERGRRVSVNGLYVKA